MNIFLSVSFSSEVDEKGVVNAAYRSDLETLIQILEEEGHEVFCAPRLEGWKVTDHNPAHALKEDLKEIDKADLYVAILGEDISAGVQLETGYAVARDKRVVLACPNGIKLGWTNSALSSFDNISSVNFGFYDSLAHQILQTVIR